jgi:hypothetical protein
MIQSETMKTSSTVPGQMVISVFSTKRVLKLMRFRAPMLRELASVNSLECSNITLEEKKKDMDLLFIIELNTLIKSSVPSYHQLQKSSNADRYK